jgi:two-component system nitrogen regulation response regulator GlnG
MSPSRVLVADDDASIRGLVRALLSRERFEVDEASNGNEVKRRMHVAHYDAIVLDLMMGPGTGVDVLDAIKADRPGERFVIIVSATSQATIDKLESSNIFAKLRKPFDINDLLGAVRQCVRPPPLRMAGSHYRATAES